MTRTKTALIGVLCFAVGLTAPFATPVALMFTKRDAKALAWPWYDTPDEDAFIGLYEPTVQTIFDRYGWFISAWYWFGLRNRAHGFDSLFAKEAPGHWPEAGSHERDGMFVTRGRWGYFVFTFGWTVYASRKFASGYEYRPQLALKTRRLPVND